MSTDAARAAPDVTIIYHGAIVSMTPVTPAATEWFDDNLPSDRQIFGGATMVEHRYALPVIEGMRLDGLEVQ